MVIWDWTYGKGPFSERGNPLLPLIGYPFRLAPWDFVYALSNRQDSTHLCSATESKDSLCAESGSLTLYTGTCNPCGSH